MSGGAARLRAVTWERQEERGVLVDPSQKKGTPAPAPVRVPESSLAFYRRYTELLLRRYMQLSLRMGKVPSVLGSCMFRGRVSSRRVESFEDAVGFVIDVERCMAKLQPEDRELIARIALQEYTQAEAAELTGQSVRSVVRKYGDAMDVLTRIFLEKELLEVGPLYAGQL